MCALTSMKSVILTENHSTIRTTKSSKMDEELILKELANCKVFDYVPGRVHRGFKSIQTNVVQTIKADLLFKWLQQHKKKLATDIAFQHLVGQ